MLNRLPPRSVDQVEAAAQGAEHAQGEDVDLEQADRVEIVLVPLDHRAFGHARILHRDQGVQWLLGDDEAAGVLREVARKTDQLAGQGQHPAQDRTLRIEAGLFQAFGAGAWSLQRPQQLARTSTCSGGRPRALAASRTAPAPW